MTKRQTLFVGRRVNQVAADRKQHHSHLHPAHPHNHAHTHSSGHDKNTGASRLDSVDHFSEVHALIAKKSALRRFYTEIYGKYSDALARSRGTGIALELGSGAGFAKSVIPTLVTSDFLQYPGIDRVVDATKMEFADQSLRCILMTNVFHHIPDVGAFLSEAQRCLQPGGRVLIVDQNLTAWTRLIYLNLHHEGFDPDAKEWKFDSAGPLSGANGALAWIVFKRDRLEFERRYPNLKVVRYEPHSPLRYWLAGGLKKWTLLPGWAFGFATQVDRVLARLFPVLCSFVDIELERV